MNVECEQIDGINCELINFYFLVLFLLFAQRKNCENEIQSNVNIP